jgi:hypothetical protein
VPSGEKPLAEKLVEAQRGPGHTAEHQSAATDHDGFARESFDFRDFGGLRAVTQGNAPGFHLGLSHETWLVDLLNHSHGHVLGNHDIDAIQTQIDHHSLSSLHDFWV